MERDAMAGRDSKGWVTRLTPETIARHARSGAWRGETLVDRAARQRQRQPDRVAVLEGQRGRTFAQLHEDAERLAAAFDASGLRSGDVVSFQLPNWIEAMVVNLAAAMRGLVCNPIVPIYRDAEVRHILRDCGAKMFFIPRSFRSIDYVEMVERMRADLPAGLEPVVVRGEAPGFTTWDGLLARAAGATPAPTPPVEPNAVKLVMYTSGTTGSPKGVLHTHNTIMAELDAVDAFFRLADDDVVLMPSPVTHITGYLYALELVFTRGLRAVLMDRWNAAEAVALVDRHRATFTVGATPFLVELVEEAQRAGSTLPSMRQFVSGGAPVPPEVVRRANRLLSHGMAFRVYGSTEAPTVTLGIQDRAQAELGATTDGRIVNHEVRIVDAVTGAEVPAGAEGEIVTRGPELMVGYTDPRHTEEAFDAEGFFHTGDLGRLSHGDYLTVTGRKKDLIIRGGENISPKEIEDVLHRMPSIREAAVVAMPHPRLGETVCAFVIPREGAPVDIDAIRAWLDAEGLARQKCPERLELVEDLPRTASGKVQKNLLRERLRAGAPTGVPR
jgi:acyl-CoA synthetase (AMP-forming)/AMP-acid ligase II